MHKPQAVRILLILLVAVLLVLGACAISIPKPPVVPSEVISVWKSLPSPQGFPPDLSGSVTLESYGNEGYRQSTRTFCLCEGQWIDVIASSNTFINFGIEKPWEVSFRIMYLYNETPFHRTATWDWEGVPKDCIHAPFHGKTLCENWITDTDKGRVFSSGVRLFAWNGAGNYYFEFINFDPHRQVEVTYKVYKLAITPGWGEAYESAKLQPWLNDLYDMLVSGTISEEEYDRAENQWLKQFK